MLCRGLWAVGCGLWAVGAGFYFLEFLVYKCVVSHSVARIYVFIPRGTPEVSYMTLDNSHNQKSIREALPVLKILHNCCVHKSTSKLK